MDNTAKGISMQKTTPLTSAAIYNRNNELVLDNAQAVHTLSLQDGRITASLSIACTDDNLFAIGESYYAFSFSAEHGPFRSELVECIRSGENPYFEWTAQLPAEHGEAGASAPATVGADEKYISIQFTNYSSQAFQRSTWGANLWDGFSWLSTSPGDTLDAHSGQQAIAASQNFDAFIAFNSGIWLCWAGRGTNFGVWVHFNYQILGLGDAPVWYVSTDGGEWTLAGKIPAEPYTWDAAKVGFKIVARPTAGHSSLLVDVIIEDTRK